MLLLIHISIALTSLAVTGFGWLKPTNQRLQVAYGLVAATLATGVWLTITNATHLLSSCVSGLIYLAIAGTGIYLTQQKLAEQN